MQEHPRLYQTAVSGRLTLNIYEALINIIDIINKARELVSI